jgi:hypothetical protein
MTKTLINRLMNRQETSLSQRRVSEDQPTSFRAMTYVRGLSEKLGKIIRDGNPTIQIAFKQKPYIRQFF